MRNRLFQNLHWLIQAFLLGAFMTYLGCGKVPSKAQEEDSLQQPSVSETPLTMATAETTAGQKDKSGVSNTSEKNRPLHVALDAAEGGDGSERAPFISIEAALTFIKANGSAAGTTVYLHNGVYRLPKTLTLSRSFSGREENSRSR